MNQTHIESRLLKEQGWLRRLARSLIQDAAAAEDAVQDTLMRALKAPPSAEIGSQASRRWLSLTLRGKVKNRLRSARRRRHHETAMAVESEKLGASAADLVAEAEVSRELVRHVMELREPHRSVLLLRYFEGRTTAAIAQELSVSNDVVRARLVRAQRELGRALDESSGGDRSVWVSSLLPLARASAPASIPTQAIAFGLMSIKTLTFAAVTLVAVTLALSAWPTTEASSSTARTANYLENSSSPEALATPSPVPLDPAFDPAFDAASRTPSGPEMDPEEIPKPRINFLVEGRIVDSENSPIEGAVVELRDLAQLHLAASKHRERIPVKVTTAADGTFRLPAACDFMNLFLLIHTDGYARRHHSVWDADREEGETESEPTKLLIGDVQLGPERTIAGVVLDDDGRPVSGARIFARGDVQADDGTDEELAYRNFRPALGLSGADGSFELTGMPQATSHVTARHDDFLPAVTALPQTSPASATASPVTLRMARAVQANGTVHFPDGFPSEPVSVFVAASQSDSRATDARFARYKISKDGSFTVPSLNQGAIYDVGLWTEHRPSWKTDPRSHGQSFVAGGPEPLTIEYQPGSTVTFRVTDDQGSPIDTFRLSVFTTASRRGSIVSSRKDPWGDETWPGGVVTLEGIVSEAPGGQLRVTIHAKGFTKLELPLIDFEGSAHVDAGTFQMKPVEAVISAPSFAVVARVETDGSYSARPLKVRHTWIPEGRTRTSSIRSGLVGADGTVAFGGLRPGQHFLWVDRRSQGSVDGRIITARGFKSSPFPYTQFDIAPDSPATTNVVVRPAPLIELSGVVTQAGAPLANAKLFLYARKFSPRDYLNESVGRKGDQEDVNYWTTPSTGEFTIDGVVPGEWTALVRAEGATFLHAEPVTITADAAPLLIDVPRAVARGRVVDEFGAPIATARVCVELSKTDWTSSYRKIRRELKTHGAATVLELGLVGLKGELSIQSGSDGRFEIPYLPTGVEWRLWVHGRDRAVGVGEPFAFEGSGEFDLGDIVLTPAAVLTVRAKSAPRYASVSIARLSESSQEPEPGVLSADIFGGVAAFKRLRAGTYRVTYQADDEGPAPTQTVTLKERTNLEIDF